MNDMVKSKKHHTEEPFSGATILQGIPELAYFFDKEVRMLRWNKNVELVIGYSKCKCRSCWR